MNCPSCGRQNPASEDRCAGCGSALAGVRDSTYDDAPTMGPTTTPPGTASGVGASTGIIARGTRLGSRYEILSVLGQGGMGTVYKAHDRELDRTVALKVIRPDLASRPPILERFKREILLASQVTHKNVLRIHDLGEAGEVKFISMNYVEGTDLSSVLRKEGPLPLERSLPMVRQMVDALQAAHDAGVVHRDLKPQNILIDAKGNAYIADFGISRSLIMEGGTMTETGQIIGTIDYMSPEQARGETADHRSDIYSLGVIMYEVFTGSLPFQGSNSLSVMMKRVHQDAPTIRQGRPQFPLWLSAIVARAMKRAPEERYQSVAELLRDIDRQRASIAWKRLLGRRALIAAAALVVLAAAGFGAVSFLTSMPSGPSAPVTSLAVMPFRNATGDATFDWARTGLPDLLRRDLMQSKALRVASEDRVEEILETLKVPDGDESRPTTLQKVASFTSADNIVSGSLMKSGELFRVQASLRNVTSSSVGPEISLEAEGRGAESLFAMMDDLAAQMRARLGAGRGWGESDRGTAELSTSSIDALKLYSEGLALSRAGQHQKASERLEQAVERDPGFAVAHALLAEMYDKLGYSEKATVAASRAAQGLGRTSPSETARIRAVGAQLANDLDAAEKAYREMCEISPNDAEAFYGLASVQEERGDLAGAQASLKRTLALDAKHTDALYALGRVFVKQGNPDEAIKYLNAVLAMHLESGSEEGRATVLNGLGNTYLRLSKYEDALDKYQQSLEIRQRIGDKRGVRVALHNIARIRGIQGQYEEAIKVARNALAVSEETRDLSGLVEGYLNLGDLFQEAGRPTESLDAYRESMRLARETGDESSLPQILSSMGYITAVLGRYDEAFVFHQQALEKRRQEGDKREIVRALNETGMVEQFQGRYERARNYYLEALSLSRESGQRASEGVLLYNLANIDEQRGEYGAALERLQSAVAVAEELNDPTQSVACQIYLGSTRLRIGDRLGAQTALRAAIDMARSIANTPLLAEALTHEGERLAADRNIVEARKVLREAVDAAKSSQDHRLILLARLEAASAAASAAELGKVLEEARSSGLKPLEGRCLLELARIRLQAGDPAGALKRAEEAVRVATPLEQRDLLLQAHHLAGVAWGAKGDAEGRLGHYRSSLTLLEEMRRGLTGEPLSQFIQRPETSSFARDAGAAFNAPAGAADAERLRVALKP